MTTFTDAVLTLLFVLACGIGGWFVFLLFARLLTAGNPFQKSEDMESDALTDWYHETRANPMPVGNPHRLKGEASRQAERELIEHSKRRGAIDAKARARSMAATAQENKETVRSFGCGCLVVPVVLAVLGYGFWLSSTCPSWDCLKALLGW